MMPFQIVSTICWSQEYIVDRPYLRTVNNTNGKAYPIKNLMKFFLPCKNRHKEKVESDYKNWANGLRIIQILARRVLVRQK